MTELVPADQIETHVGAPRHPTQHLARAAVGPLISTVFILHSHQCRDSGIDLRDCEFSRALDLGVDADDWDGYEDRPVVVEVRDDRLVPVDVVQQYLDRLRSMDPTPRMARYIDEVEAEHHSEKGTDRA